MNKILNIWGRDFSLKVTYDAYTGEAVLDIQKEALASFISAADEILASSKEVKQYCLEKNGDLIEKPVENIFKYVIPEELFIKRDEKKRVVMLLCNYRFDEEHGIALTFENEVLKHIGPQDDDV